MSSNTLMRGVEPATQGGFFCVPAKGFSTYKRRPAFTESGFGPGNTRASGVLDSGTARAAFLFCANVQHTRNVYQQTLRPGNHRTRRTANYPAALQTGRTHHAPRFDAAAARIPAVFEAPKRQARTAPAEDGLKADYLPLYSSYFINLQCVSTVKR